MGLKGQPERQLAAAEHRAEVVSMKLEGMTFAEIGEAKGYSKQRAQAVFRQALAAIPADAVEALRAEHLAETARAREIALAGMERDYIAHSQGRVIIDPDTGEKVEDYGPKLDAARTLIAIQAREAKLVGADAPQRTETEGVHRVRYEIIGVSPDELL